MTISPFAPEKFPELPPLAGFDMAVAEAGIRYKGRTDLWVLRGQPGTEIAGVYTRNVLPGAPITWSKRALNVPVDRDAPRLVVVNSGTANVFCGADGDAVVAETARAAASEFGGQAETVQVASTGVIGEPLNVSKLTAALPGMAFSADLWEASARAIMTTDTFPKGATATVEIHGVPVTINGIAKGSGMIAPDMATMLAYVATDAKIGQDALQALLSSYAALTFNAITVDSDTSTSDTLLLAASGAAEHPMIMDPHDPALESFKDALLTVMLSLAHQVAKDGEGASKFITVQVSGAVNDDSARNIAFSIANSPLVKTAIAGEDANWGRIIMAVGKAGEPADRDKLNIWMGPYLLAEKGAASSEYSEELGSKYMKNDEITLKVDLGLGGGQYTAWTCDLTHRYIDINADYRS